jgi:hypothetical protein
LGAAAVIRPRRTIFVDREVQGTLVWRVLLYWNFFVLATALLLVGREFCIAPHSDLGDVTRGMFSRYSPVLFASLLLLPVVMLDVLRTTNRMAGPVARLRKSLCDLAEGRPVQPLNFRAHDFWHDMAANLNRAAARVAASPLTQSAATEVMPEAADDGSDWNGAKQATSVSAGG